MPPTEPKSASFSNAKDDSAPPETNDDYERRLSELEAALAAARAAAPISVIPEHGGGVGMSVAQTWSAYDQALAVAGNHPDQP